MPVIDDYALTVRRTVVAFPNVLGWRAWLDYNGEQFYAEASTERKAIRAVRRKAYRWARYGPVEATPLPPAPTEIPPEAL